MNGKKIFQIDPENRPNRTVSERVVSERGRKELPPGTKGGENLKPNRYYEHKQHASDTFCQGCLRTFFAVIQNQTLDFVAHGFFARFAEMDFDAVGGLSDFLYHYRWRGFLYGQRGSGCGGAAVAGVVVHRLSFP